MVILIIDCVPSGSRRRAIVAARQKGLFRTVVVGLVGRWARGIRRRGRWIIRHGCVLSEMAVASQEMLFVEVATSAVRASLLSNSYEKV